MCVRVCARLQHNAPSDAIKKPWYSVSPVRLSVLGDQYRLLRCDANRSDIFSLALVVPEFSNLGALGLPMRRTRYALSLREFIAQS